jgi:hypothetical protein
MHSLWFNGTAWSDLTAYVINPLVSGVPPIVIALIPNCNTFTAVDVKRDAGKLFGMLETSLVPILGPLLGLDSGNGFLVNAQCRVILVQGCGHPGSHLLCCADGDSRRRAFQFSRSCTPAGSQVHQYKAIDHASFIFSGRIKTVNGKEILTHIDQQDWLHCESHSRCFAG